MVIHWIILFNAFRDARSYCLLFVGFWLLKGSPADLQGAGSILFGQDICVFVQVKSVLVGCSSWHFLVTANTCSGPDRSCPEAPAQIPELKIVASNHVKCSTGGAAKRFR